MEVIINECQPGLTLPEIPDQITVTQGDDDNVITLENASNNNCRFVVELFDYETLLPPDRDLFYILQPYFNQTNADDPLVQIDK